jgi:hypothetical protein
VVNVHTGKKIKRKRKGGGRTVSIVTEAEDKIYRITRFKRRRLGDSRYGSPPLPLRFNLLHGMYLDHGRSPLEE